MNHPSTLQPIHDTLPLDLALLRFQGDVLILQLCLISGFAGLFSGGVLGTEDAGNPGNDRVPQ